MCNLINFFLFLLAGGARDVQCTDALLYMMAVDMMPLRTPERRGFQVFCKTLQPLYRFPTEQTLTREMEQKYYRLRSFVGKMMEEAENITLTFDVWTHSSTMKSYLGCTAHFRRGNYSFFKRLRSKNGHSD